MASIPLLDLVRPEHTAIVTQEVQGGVIGAQAKLRELADMAAGEAVPNIARLLPEARRAGVRVVHCVVHRRPDGLGSNTNARLFNAARHLDIAPSTPGGTVLPELGPEPGDLVLTRLHGIGPMSGTDLDIVLRNLGIRTVVAVGVSVNIAITNLVMDAVNAGYQVVVPRDAVAGIPADYAAAVLDNTLALIATLTNTDELIRTWTASAVPA